MYTRLALTKSLFGNLKLIVAVSLVTFTCNFNQNSIFDVQKQLIKNSNCNLWNGSFSNQECLKCLIGIISLPSCGFYSIQSMPLIIIHILRG